ncbi:MAG: cellulase family glycosylhydrolase [Nitrososphaeraceae archaeon]
MSLANTRIFFVIVLAFVLAAVLISSTWLGSYASKGDLTGRQPINGVAMKGAFVNMKQHGEHWTSAPQNYIEDSLRMISGAGLNHVRLVFYWEAYERDPDAFIKEIQSVATAGDKYGLKIIYDNHQWHTSSWLEERATGFPWSLFQDSKYSKGDGGNTQDKAAQIFWKDWWNRSVKDKQGNDGWTLMAEYLKKIVLAVDNHSSTLGYEILSEPHVDNTHQWSKIGKFNSFITSELRNITSKTIIYSMNVPVDLNSHIKILPKNLAKMAPSSKENIAFKISVYGIPGGDGYQEKRFDMFLKTRDLTGIPLYIGEWNNVVRTKEGGVSKLDPDLSELTKTEAKKILGALKKEKVWGPAFWRWDYQPVVTDNFNLVSDKSGKLVPTKYFGILKDTVKKVYGSYGSTSTDFTTSVGRSSIDHGQQTNLINELVKTGKFTEAEAKQFASTIMQDDADDTSISNDTESTNNQTNPEEYENLKELVDDIKNKVVDIEEIPLKPFQDSDAYKGADQETQDCIDLAGKIGQNLGDQEIVHCSEDANYFENKLF